MFSIRPTLRQFDEKLFSLSIHNSLCHVILAVLVFIVIAAADSATSGNNNNEVILSDTTKNISRSLPLLAMPQPPPLPAFFFSPVPATDWKGGRKSDSGCSCHSCIGSDLKMCTTCSTAGKQQPLGDDSQASPSPPGRHGGLEAHPAPEADLL